MRRLLSTFVVVSALVAASLSTSAAVAQPVNNQVVVVLAPYLMWQDLTPTSTPTLWSLAERGALGAINARSRAREPGEPSSPLEGALTISAGAWAVPSYPAAAALRTDERHEVGTAAEAFRRTTGFQVGTNRIVFLGMPVTQRVNAERSFRVVLGTLGQSVEDAGGTTAAVGNSDVGYVTGEQRRVRPAALAAMNGEGLVALGDVSTRLLREDPNAPFGIETDPEAFDTALRDVVEASSNTSGPVLVVLDAGDAYRAKKFEPQVTEEIARQHRSRAVAALDDVVRSARERFPGAVIIVASQSTGDVLAGQMEGLGPLIISGGGWSGILTSNSTQRDGVVTNLDLTATVLDILGLERPVQVLGNEMRLIPAAGSVEERVETLSGLDATAVAIDSAKVGVVNTFVIFTVVVLALSAVVIARHRHWSSRMIRWFVASLEAALLLALAVPLASWLMFAWARWPADRAQVSSALIITTLGVWLAGLALRYLTPMRVPVAAMSLATCVVLLVDQWLGAPFSFTNFFGYSPLRAARFYGIGNEASAMLFGASIVGLALLSDEWPESRWVALLKRYGVPVIGFVVVVTSAAPFWGANVGVAIWGTAGFAIAWLLMNGHRVSLKTVTYTALLMITTIGVFALIDLFGPGSQTHLGRALVSADTGGLVELWKIVARKAETNMRVLTHTNWAYILIAVVAFLAFMRWRPQGDFADTLARNPGFADAITVSLVAGLVAYFTEDSGIVIPALEVFYVGVAIAWLMLARVRGTLDRGDSP